jgi:hypothetical protein
VVTGNLPASYPQVSYLANPQVAYLANPQVAYLANPQVAYLANPQVAYLANPQVAYLANPQLGLQVCQTVLVALTLGQGVAMNRDEVPTSPAVLNLENKHAGAERLSSPRG